MDVLEVATGGRDAGGVYALGAEPLRSLGATILRAGVAEDRRLQAGTLDHQL